MSVLQQAFLGSSCTVPCPTSSNINPLALIKPPSSFLKRRCQTKVSLRRFFFREGFRATPSHAVFPAIWAMVGMGGILAWLITDTCLEM